MGGLEREITVGGVARSVRGGRVIMRFLSERTICIPLYTFGVLFAGYLAWLPLPVSISHFLYEDMFYYLTVAQNIIEGRGVTLDGVAPTNGFQPLWMLICMGVQYVAGKPQAVHVILTVAAMLHVVQSMTVMVILRGIAGRVIAHGVALFYLFNYRVLACNLCGLEVPLAVAFVLLVVLFLVRRGFGHGLGQSALLGILLGACVLARFDLLLLLAVVVTLVFIAGSRDKTCRWAGVRSAVVVLLLAAVVLVPWFVWSLRQSGAMLPNSHAALKLWGFDQFELAGPLSHNISLLRERVFGAAWWLTDTANLLGLWPIPLPDNRKIGGIAFLVAACAALALLVRCRQDRHAKTAAWLLCFAGIHCAYYFLFASAQVRYLMPAVAVFLVAMGILAGITLRQSRRVAVRVAWGGVFLVLLANASVAGALAWQKCQGATRTHRGHGRMLTMAQWIDENTHEGAVIGSWNAGIFSYFSGRQVVNLDGVINDDAIIAIRDRRLLQYILDREIDYLIEDPRQIEEFMDRFGGDDTWREWFPVFHTSKPPYAGWQPGNIRERRRDPAE